VVVGRGINCLVGGGVLAKAGWKVCVLERNSWFGGTIRSAEITEPGFVHDLFSAWHPLFVGSEAYSVLARDLGSRGLVYLNTDYPTAALFPDGSAAFLSTSQSLNEQEFERLAHGVGGGSRQAGTDPSRRTDPSLRPPWTEFWSWEGFWLRTPT